MLNKRTKEEELKLLRQYLTDTCEDMECLDGCNSLAHEDDCPVVNVMAAFRRLREMILDAQKYITDAHAGQVRNITPLQALQEQASYYEDMIDEQDKLVKALEKKIVLCEEITDEWIIAENRTTAEIDFTKRLVKIEEEIERFK